ncbi:1-acyl-sn-glycerol-3-phosphate acyltransferase 2 [Cryptomeria japonica]|uniref:1-acyl-sn-glycerol-3-phosphate acyltransferase 2 n=1 Tax=Cryptomeria japonica TaxID=3369 RepID=UPI0027DA6667|nr:1-acyl-sn-glycerol-3-phosphate acyltransferase 2 [Cryptomeria japonica]
MELAAAVFALPISVIFLLSGLIVNFFQAILFLIVLPFSRNLYRRANIIMMDLLWSELVWLVTWWAGVKIRVYTDADTWKLMGKEHALLVCNHRSDIDWLVGWVLAQHFGCLGSARAIMKKSSKFLPVVGWSMWFSEYVFLERNWSRDEATLKSGFQRLKDFPRPFWLGLFVEGTRFTTAKLLAAQEYATSTGLPVPRNLLIPRTKGFVSAVGNLRSFVPAIYDITVAIPKEEPSPTMLRLLKGQPSVMHVHIKRQVMDDLPRTDEGVAQWCRDAFVSKDDLLDKHKLANTFGEELYQPMQRRAKPLMVIIGWSSILVIMASKLLRPHLATRKGVALLLGGIAMVTLSMHILIVFSQSERSTPAKVAPGGKHTNGRNGT